MNNIFVTANYIFVYFVETINNVWDKIEFKETIFHIKMSPRKISPRISLSNSSQKVLELAYKSVNIHM